MTKKKQKMIDRLIKIVHNNNNFYHLKIPKKKNLKLQKIFI